MENTEEQIEKIDNLLAGEKKPFPFFLMALVGVIIFGVLSGYLISKRKVTEPVFPGGAGIVAPEEIKAGQEYGLKTQNFKDTTIGILEKGGIGSEGTHNLTREGGPSQTAYLTSSVLDLDQFVGKKIQVWGETFQGQKAGWLMDVGRLKILE